MRLRGGFTVLSFAAVAAVAGTASAGAQALAPKEQLGKSIYFDQHLSINQNEACAACHAPEVGFTGPIDLINAHGSVYEGSVPGRFGNRKPPSAAYATVSPVLFVDHKGLFTGGNFWDGRATGEKLGNPAADQAQGPFLNPREQGLSDSACVVYNVCNPAVPGDYPVSFQSVWGEGACAISWPVDVLTACATEGSTVTLSAGDRAKVESAYDEIALSIAAYEASAEVNAFSSEFDATFGGKVQLSREAQRGFALFRGKAKCHRCHVSNAQRPLFTDFTYDNLGVPRNPENPVYDYDSSFVDHGLGGFLATRQDYASYAEDNDGKQKVPTLRNVGKGSCEAGYSPCIVKAYTHNGYFKSLLGIVHFYNTRDVLPTCAGDFTEAEALAANCWPLPEVAENVNRDELGDLGLTLNEEEAIVAFLLSLSDGFTP